MKSTCPPLLFLRVLLMALRAAALPAAVALACCSVKHSMRTSSAEAGVGADLPADSSTVSNGGIGGNAGSISSGPTGGSQGRGGAGGLVPEATGGSQGDGRMSDVLPDSGDAPIDMPMSTGRDAACNPAKVVADLLDGRYTASVGSPVPCQCLPASDSGVTGSLIFDGEGRLIDDTRDVAADKQAWLDSLANQHWPCVAGQTIQYQCSCLGI